MCLGLVWEVSLNRNATVNWKDPTGGIQIGGGPGQGSQGPPAQSVALKEPSA